VKNKAVDFIIEHLGVVLAVYHDQGSHEIAWINLSKVILPEIVEVLDFERYKYYAEIILGLDEKIGILSVLDNLEELKWSRQEITRLKLINNQLKIENSQQETRETNKQSECTLNNDKQKLIIAGWSVQESHGYFRAFKRIDGKMKGIYLGKTLEGAEQKIRGKEKNLQSGK
jgi:hypothetical protein